MPDEPAAAKVAVLTVPNVELAQLPALSPPLPRPKDGSEQNSLTASGKLSHGSNSILQVPAATAVATTSIQPEASKDDANASKENDGTPPEHAKLNNFLRRRSTRMELQLRNIIRIEPTDETANAVGVEGANKSFSERKKILKSCLKRRMSKKELVDKNIIKDPSVTTEPVTFSSGSRRVSLSPTMSNNITTMAEQLRRAQISDTINQHLQRRPSKAEIPPRILSFHETVEVSDTFRRGEYNRKPDQEATYRRLTPRLKQEIRAELNEFKRNEMDVHEESSQFTTFH